MVSQRGMFGPTDAFGRLVRPPLGTVLTVELFYEDSPMATMVVDREKREVISTTQHYLAPDLKKYSTYKNIDFRLWDYRDLEFFVEDWRFDRNRVNRGELFPGFDYDEDMWEELSVTHAAYSGEGWALNVR